MTRDCIRLPPATSVAFLEDLCRVEHWSRKLLDCPKAQETAIRSLLRDAHRRLDAERSRMGMTGEAG